jgi:hypothetical protein
MDFVEGGPQPPVRQSALAYVEAEQALGEDSRESAVRQDSSDGDVAEATFTADIQTLQRQLEERERESEKARWEALELQQELEAARAESAALKAVVRDAAVTEAAAGAAESKKTDPKPPPKPPATQAATPAPPQTSSPPVAPAVSRDGATEPETAARIVSEAFAELAKVRTEAFKARKALEQERQQHRAEMLRARGQYNSAQDELQRLIKVRRSAPPVVAKTPSSTVPAPVILPPPHSEGIFRKVGLSVALAVGLAAVTTFWPRMTRWSEARAEQAPVSRTRRAEEAEIPAIPLTPVARAQFQGAVGRLSRVLAARSGKAPEQLLREVHEANKATDPTLCAFDWRNGQPSLRYGGGRLSLGQTILKCADAIEKLR